MGIDEPNHGPLTRSMVVTSPARLSGLIQPKVEPEIAVRIGGGASAPEFRFCLEVVDSIWTDYRFTWAHNTADGSSAAFAVLGDEIPGDPDNYRVQVRSSAGVEVAASVADSRPDVSECVMWLRDQRTTRELAPGDIVLTGGLADPLDLPAGGWIEANFLGPTTTITVRVERDGA